MKINKIQIGKSFLCLTSLSLFPRLARLSTIRLIPSGRVTPGVLPQMIFAVERTAAFHAGVPILTRVHHLVQGQLLLALERFATHRAGIRSLRAVALPVPRQVVLALESRTADIAHEPPFRRVRAQVFLQQMLVQVLGPTLRTPEHGGAVRAAGYPYLARFRFDLRRRRRRRRRAILGRRGGVRLSALLFPLLRGFRLVPRAVFARRLSRILEEVVQGERGRQMGQVIGHGRTGRGDALPRRRHAVGLQRRLAVVAVGLLRPGAVEVRPADAREVLVDLKRTGSEVGADHREVHLLEYVARTERGSHRCRGRL